MAVGARAAASAGGSREQSKHQQYDKASKDSFQHAIATLILLFGLFGKGKAKSWSFLPSVVMIAGRDPDHVVEFVLDDGRKPLLIVELATFAAGPAGRESQQMI